MSNGANSLAASGLKIDWAQMPTYNTIMAVALRNMRHLAGS